MIVPTWVGDAADGSGGEGPPINGGSPRKAGFDDPSSSVAMNGIGERYMIPSMAARRRRTSNGGKLRKPKSWRRWISDGLSAGFYSHGQHISRHQIRTLLITSLVICSLFYPAVGIFLWSSKGGPGLTRGDASSIWQSLSTPLLDSFASSERRHYNSLRDLRMIWDDEDDLRAMDVRDAAMIFSKDRAELCFSSSAKAEARVKRDSKKAGQSHPIFPFGGLPEILGSRSEEKEEKAPLCRSVRVEHLFITTDDIISGEGARYGVLDAPIMQSALRLQTALEDMLIAGRNVTVEGQELTLRCVEAKTSSQPPADFHRGGSCLSLSPMDYWSASPALLSSDDEPHQTLRYNQQHSTTRGLPLSILTTLAGRWHLFNKFPRAEYLVMTFFLDADAEGAGTASRPDTTLAHKAWVQMLNNVTAGQVALITPEAKQAKELLLQFQPLRNKRMTGSRVLLGVGYFALIIYITHGIASVKRVHSRFGLAFTAAVELVIAMIMSISICSLIGIRLALVPWEIMPFVILVVGSENMFMLTNALVSTPVELPVSTRMAQGLASVGVPVTLTVISDIVLIGIIASATPVAAVREFCIFAIFLLITDWFMQMSFFATVLSIDMQRLELADMLTQGGKQEGDADRPALGGVRGGRRRSNPRQLGRTKATIKLGVRAIWRARAARTASLSLLLAFMFGLYLYYGTGYPLDQPVYTTGPEDTFATTAQSVPTTAFDPLSHLQGSDAGPVDLSPWWTRSPSAALWQSINPKGTAQVRMIVEPWSIISLRSAKQRTTVPKTIVRSFAGWALFRPRIRAIIWLLKLVVLPISATTALLWVLLLYLLKDTELLEAQQDKSIPLQDNALWSKDGSVSRVNEAFDVQLHHGRALGDINTLAESKHFMATVDLTGTFCIRPKLDTTSLGGNDVWGKISTTISSDMRARGDGITAVHFDEDIGTALIGTRTGLIKAVSLNTAVDISTRFLRSAIPEKAAVIWIGVLRKASSGAFTPRTALITAHSDGSVVESDIASGDFLVVVPPGETGKRWNVLRAPVPSTSKMLDQGLPADDLTAIALISSTGECDVWAHSKQSGQWTKLIGIDLPGGELARCVALIPRPRGLPSPSLSDGSETIGPDVALAQLLLVGSSAGILRAYDLMSGCTVQNFDIGDGPIVKIMLPTNLPSAEHHFIAAVQTRARIWFIRVSLNAAVFEPSSIAISDSTLGKGSPFSSLNSLEPKTPTRPAIPLASGNGVSPGYFLTAALPEDGPPKSPTASRSYPMSTHGSRNRRASSYTARGERSLGAPDGDNDKVLRVAGVTDCTRGAADIVDHYLVGIRKSLHRPDESQSRSPWQIFAADLHASLLVKDGETKVASAPVYLEHAYFDAQEQSNERNVAPAIALAFANIGPTQSSTDKKSLFFTFGNIVGEIVPTNSRANGQKSKSS